ncbi:unnamed protein product [Paramecium sonneborni]|uniref:G-patch domain-containing protein n=1 Tax=Paramecium sonneborni TaxID=65129 RepID=A0A8S1QRA8_9CILI|nr:unnamed protein product [Paramecium sonneborni]
MNYQNSSLLQFDIEQPQQIQQKENQKYQQQNLLNETGIQNKEENPSTKLQEIYKEHRKNQAFSNFIKYHSPLFSQVEKGVKIKMVNNNNIYQEMDKDYQINKVKSVQFNLQNNYVYQIIKHPNEYLTLNERFNLQRNIQQYAMQNRFDSTSEEEDDEIEEQLSFIEIIVKDFGQQPKSIMKKQTQQFKHEAEDDEEDYQNKNLSFKEIRNLEKKVKEHDYGVGLQLLQKLGFKYGEGLGINRQGILEPLIPIKKQVFTGSQSNQNKNYDEEQIWQFDQPQETKTMKKMDKIWRKKNQKDYYNNQQLSNSFDTKANIIQQYLAEVSEITQSVQHLLITKLSKYQINEQIIQQQRKKIITLDFEQEKTLHQLEKQSESIRRKESFQKYLLFFQDDEVQISNEPFPLFEKFKECFIKHPDLFIQFNLIEVLIKQGVEEIKQMIQSWEGPITNILENEFNLIFKIINLVKDVFVHQKSLVIVQNHKKSQILVIDNLITKNDYLHLQNIIDIFINPIKSKLENYIHSQYNPCLDNLLFQMLTLWHTDVTKIEIEEDQDEYLQKLKLFNQKTIQNLCNIIIPKLKQLIVNWNINDSFQLHKIILPWIESQFKIQELYHELTLKLLNIDLEDQPDFGLNILIPWSKFQDIQWNQILSTQVVSKMIHSIQNLNIASNFEVAQKILLYFDYIQEYTEIIFQPLIEKLNDYVCLNIQENINSQNPEVNQEIFQLLNQWELILQDKVLKKVDHLNGQFNLIKKKLLR